MRRELPRVLLTGFGPFPGVAENASGSLAVAVTHLARQRWRDAEITCVLLPTEWRAGPSVLTKTLAEHQPDVVVHLGVSGKASGLVIETLARNRARSVNDAAGRTPVDNRVAPGGPASLRAPIAIGGLMARLAREGVPAVRSNDAGRYICNAVYYHSLAAAHRSDPRRQVVLVHLPPLVGETGVLEADKPVKSMPGDLAVTGLMSVIGYCLGHVRPGRVLGAIERAAGTWTSIGV